MSEHQAADVRWSDLVKHSNFARLAGIIGLSAKQLRHRFLESLLILLSIALGVGVLTGMETFLRFLGSLEREMLLSRPEMGAVIVEPKRFDVSELYGDGGVAAVRLGGGMTEPIQLTTDDLLAVRAEVPNIAQASAGQSGSSGSPIVAVDGHPWQPPSESPDSSGPNDRGGATAPARRGASGPTLVVEQMTPDDIPFRGREMLAGRTMTWTEYVQGSPVLVLEEESFETLFPGSEPEDAIGHSVTAGRFGGPGGAQGVEWRIIGVVAKQEQPAWRMGPMREANVIRGYGPHTVGTSEPAPVRQIVLAPANESEIDELINALEVFFARRYGPDRVTVRSPAENLRQIAENRRNISLTLMGLAGLALLVASVNILNLFTARVICRRRLTAMSVALGAERRSLFGRMLAEALLLGAAGSILGMFPAQGVVLLLRSLLIGNLGSSGAGVNPYEGLGLALPDALVGLAAGMGASLLFGLYPAYLSASIDPADGLRAE